MFGFDIFEHAVFVQLEFRLSKLLEPSFREESLGLLAKLLGFFLLGRELDNEEQNHSLHQMLLARFVLFHQVFEDILKIRPQLQDISVFVVKKPTYRHVVSVLKSQVFHKLGLLELVADTFAARSSLDDKLIHVVYKVLCKNTQTL